MVTVALHVVNKGCRLSTSTSLSLVYIAPVVGTHRTRRLDHLSLAYIALAVRVHRTHLLLIVTPSPSPTEACWSPSMERVSIEVWQQILLKVIETNDWPIFTTSCTPYTVLGFTYLYNRLERDGKRPPYLDYLAQRRRLRLVCHAWNEFVLFTSHRWLPLEDRPQPDVQARLDDYSCQRRSWSHRNIIHENQPEGAGDPYPHLGFSHSETPGESVPPAGLHAPSQYYAYDRVQPA